MFKEALKEIQELIKYRELLKNLVLRDLKVRYRRSVLGFVWVMLNPLLMMLILTVIFSELFRISTENYAVYLLSGIVMWNFFSQSTTMAVKSLLENSNLIKKIYLPKSVFPLSLILSALTNFTFSLIPLVFLLLLNHVPLGPQFYLLPLALFLLFVFAFGISLLLSTLTVFFHDMIYIYEVLLLAWMYATPVFYPEAIVPGKFRFILELNPIYYFVKLFRGWLYMDIPFLSPELLYGASFSLLSLLAGYVFYIHYKDRVVYYL